jgi:hypothetical protein
MRSEHELGEFIPIRMSLMEALGGDLAAAYVWAHIRFRGQLTDGKYQVTQDKLMTELVIGRKRLRRALEVLRDEGWLAWERSSWNDATLIYETHDPSSETGQPEDTQEEQPEDTQGERPEDTQGERPANAQRERSIYLQETLRKERTPHTPQPNGVQTVAPPAAASGQVMTSEDQFFKEFWDRATHKTGKVAARTALTKSLTKTTPERIAQAWTAANEAWQTWPDKSKAPHPATWLNQERWLDEPPMRATPTTPTNALSRMLLAAQSDENEQKMIR